MRKVIEEDFRLPEYRHAKVEDYEFREDGKLVRKDRWEMAVQKIRHLVGIETPEFEIPDVIEAVKALAWEYSASLEEWIKVEDSLPESYESVTIKLENGSILTDACYHSEHKNWTWNVLCLTSDVTHWKP